MRPRLRSSFREPSRFGARGALGALIALSLGAAIANAQTAFTDVVINGPGGFCLEVAGPWSATSPPPPGTPLTLAVCNGAVAQRFNRCLGDCQDDITFGWSEIVALGSAAAIGPPHESTAELDGTSIRLWLVHVGNTPATSSTARCLTSPMPPVPGTPLRAEVCDGRPGQRFVITP